MHVCAEAPHLDLLALARFDGQRVGVHPFVRGHIRRVLGVCQDVKDGGFLEDRKICDLSADEPTCTFRVKQRTMEIICFKIALISPAIAASDLAAALMDR